MRGRFAFSCYIVIIMYMANTVTIPKTEYKRLKQAAERYETIREALAPMIVPEFPEESFEDYEDPKRLKASYNRALKDFKNGRISSVL